MKNPYPGDELLNVEAARTAAVRFDKEATHAPARAEIDTAPDRRKQYLKDALTEEKARAVVADAETHGAPSSAQDTLAGLAEERIIGSSDLRDVNYLELAVAVARSVCRIRVGRGAGTGVLVGPRLLLTNNHVLRTPEQAQNAEAQFDYQENASGELLPVQTYAFDPDTFFVTDRKLDFTVVALAPASSQGRPLERYPWNRLNPTLGKAEAGDPINIIQHPRGGLKQVALRNNEVIVIPNGKPDFLYYTTDTEPGSSGSPCFNDQWEIIALHHSGVPRMEGETILKKDGTPWDQNTDDPALVDWIANEGARVSAMVASLRAVSLDDAASALRETALTGTPPNPVRLARSAEVATLPAAHGVPGGIHGVPVSVAGAHHSIVPGAGAVSIQVPLTITVSLGGGATPVTLQAGADTAATPDTGADTATPASTPLVVEAARIDPDWSTRRGYDPAFLGIEVPLPTLSRAMRTRTVEVPEEFRVHGNKHELAYHHYSVALNRERRFAWYSAANIDGRERPKLPKRRDTWYIDPRIDDPSTPTNQLGEDLYAAKRTDRGHLTRYLDVAWGTPEEARDAAADTFHFTNACLQLDGFNQRTSRWQGIEQFLLERKAASESRRLSVMTGPLFRPTDPLYRNEFMDAAVRVPLGFWKVCALVREDGTLSATAFVLEQADITTLAGFDEAFLDVAAVQTTIENVEKETGLTFGVLRDNDHLAGGGAPGSLEVDGRTVIPLHSLDDIVT
ncbi:MAG TPA: hypothetical protein GXZ45_11190 [Propionibacterium sp.]|nr:hypothetical protein [Propionibacterium sp.]